LAHGAAGSKATIPDHEAVLAREVLAQNEECLQLFVKGIARKRIQFPEFTSLTRVQEESETINRLSDVARLLLLRGKLLASEGDLQTAAAVHVSAMRCGEMICNGDGQLLHYLIGLWIRGAAMRSISRLAAVPEIPLQAVQQLYAAVKQSLGGNDGLQQSLRVDFQTIALRQLDQTTDSGDLETIVRSVVHVYYLPEQTFVEDAGYLPPSQELDAWLESWSDEICRQLLVIFQGHPRPFDKLATARTMGRFVANEIRALDAIESGGLARLRGWWRQMQSHRDRSRLARQLRDWPVELSPGMAPHSDDEPRHHGADYTSASGLSDVDLIEARHRLQNVENPLGNVLTQNALTFDYSPFMLEHRGMMKSLSRLLGQRLRQFKR
jgi:hypothetical protein